MESTQPIPTPSVTELERRPGPTLLKGTIDDRNAIDDFGVETVRTTPWDSAPQPSEPDVAEAAPSDRRRWIVVALAAAAIIQAPFVGFFILSALGLVGRQ